MPSATVIQTNFSAGEISPLLFSRVEINKYRNGAEDITNFIVQRFGGARKRGGTQFINEVKTSAKKTRLVSFTYSRTQAYILEFGDQYIRIYINGGVVESASVPVEVSTPYLEDDLFDIQFAQSADVLYLAHPSYAPRKFIRSSATSFSLETVPFEDGPFLEFNSSSTTLTPDERGSITPVMTNNTTPSGTASAASSNSNAYEAFDGDLNPYETTVSSGWVAYDFPSTDTKVADAYWLQAERSQSQVIRTPTSWKFQGYDGSDWITLDSRPTETGWITGERRFYEFRNTTGYDAYRIKWETTGDNVNGYSSIGELGIHEGADTQTAFDLTASSTTGINGGAGFSSNDVGRAIRLLGTDGRWRWARIQSVTSTTVVKITLYDHALPDTDPINSWRLGAWSEETGWPACVSFYEGRIAFANITDQPQTVWISQTDAFENFGTSSPGLDTDAIAATIRSDSVNDIKWLAEGTDLFIGTSEAIRTIGPNTSTGSFSPTNILSKRESSYGASSVQPVRVGNVLIYSGYFRKDLREISYSFQADGYASQELSILSEHFLRGQIKQMAYQKNPDSVVWIVTEDGALVGMTYERDQDVIAFHGHVLGGTSVTVESVAVIPGSEFDEVWLVVKRIINGAEVRYIERLSRGLIDTDVIENSTFLDCHLTYSGVSTSTLSGLDHLEGESVKVWSDTGEQGPFTVSSGSITLASNVTVACVGYGYTSSIETLSPEAAAAGGTAQTRIGHISEVFLRLNRSQGGKAGPVDGILESLEYESSDLFDGDIRVPIEMEWNRGKRMKIEHNEPTPFHVLGIIAETRVSG